ncbi:hypothetical protein Tco_0704609 [Tanacetum coccineum]|uniref:Uncharacterized protein n=1 Tax=Tanacetum coccineum TaxID=301880 RepID=A0ABQ4Y3U9_9ASTR
MCEEEVSLNNNIGKQIVDFVDMPSEAVEQRMDANVLDKIDGAKGEQVPNHVVKKGNLEFLVCKEAANPGVNELVDKGRPLKRKRVYLPVFCFIRGILLLSLAFASRQLRFASFVAFYLKTLRFASFVAFCLKTLRFASFVAFCLKTLRFASFVAFCLKTLRFTSLLRFASCDSLQVAFCFVVAFCLLRFASGCVLILHFA